MVDSTNGKGCKPFNSGLAVAGVGTTGGLIAFVLQLKVPEPEKMLYIGLVCICAFAGSIVMFILNLFQWHIEKHDLKSMEAHTEMIATLRALCAEHKVARPRKE